jgi:hypothetical protein
MSSAFFATAVTDTVTIGDVTVTIKKLNWKQLRKASEAQTAAYYALVGKAPKGLLDAQAERAKERAADADIADKPKEHNYAGYDRDVVLQAGVKSWTVDAKLPSGLDDLDEATAEHLHKAILDLSLPPLDPAAVEAERKND